MASIPARDRLIVALDLPSLAEARAFVVKAGPAVTFYDARLIAASPDFYAALQMVCDSGCMLAEPIERAMLDALKLASGEA